MIDRLQEICEIEYARYAKQLADKLFDAAAELPGADNFFTTPFMETPIIGGRFWAGFDDPELRQRVVRALVAREQFHRDAPPTAPALPLTETDCAALEDDDNPLNVLTGLFGTSLRFESWDPKHPRFAAFASGVMACRRAPARLRDDPELLRAFPARRLKGLRDDWLAWCSPETWALDRRARALQAAWDAQK